MPYSNLWWGMGGECPCHIQICGGGRGGIAYAIFKSVGGGVPMPYLNL